ELGDQFRDPLGVWLFRLHDREGRKCYESEPNRQGRVDKPIGNHDLLWIQKRNREQDNAARRSRKTARRHPDPPNTRLSLADGTAEGFARQLLPFGLLFGRQHLQDLVHGVLVQLTQLLVRFLGRIARLEKLTPLPISVFNNLPDLLILVLRKAEFLRELGI